MLKLECYTPRLMLVGSQPELAPLVTEYFSHNREFLSATESAHEDIFYMEEYQVKKLKDEALSFRKRDSVRFWIFKRNDSSRIIGTFCLGSIVYGAFMSCFLGYRLSEENVGRGYMTEAIGKAVDIGFSELGLHRIEANIMPRNISSKRVVQKNGFVYEGISHDYLLINGIWEAHEHWVRINDK